MNEYYSLTGLLTQGGAIVGTTLVTATVGKLGGEKVTPYLKFVAVFLALMFAFLFAQLGQSGAASPWAIALLTLVNGAIVFLSAMGGNEMMTTATRGSVADLTPEAPVQRAPVEPAGYRDPSSPKKPAPTAVRFFHSWF
jgi:hypothetical protein